MGKVVGRLLLHRGAAEHLPDVVISQEPLRYDQRPRLGASEHLPGLGTAVAGVEGNHDPARRENAKRGDYPPIGIGRPQSHAISRPNTQRGEAASSLQDVVG